MVIRPARCWNHGSSWFPKAAVATRMTIAMVATISPYSTTSCASARLVSATHQELRNPPRNRSMVGTRGGRDEGDGGRISERRATTGQSQPVAESRLAEWSGYTFSWTLCAVVDMS